MGLTFKKRDDFEKLMDGLGVSTVDLVPNEENIATAGTEKKVDPFAKFLAPEAKVEDKKSDDKK